MRAVRCRRGDRHSTGGAKGGCFFFVRLFVFLFVCHPFWVPVDDVDIICALTFVVQLCRTGGIKITEVRTRFKGDYLKIGDMVIVGCLKK